MNKPTHDSESLRADEFDRLLSAMLRGQMPATDGPALDETARFTRQLVATAGQLQPRPVFQRRLRAQLRRRAAEKSPEKSWQGRFTMKRTAYSLAGLAALVVVAFVGWTLFKDQIIPPAEPAAVAIVATEWSQPAAGPTPAPVPTEAPLTGAGGDGTSTEAADMALRPFGGMGGGGGAGGGEGGPFHNATLSLSAEPPTIDRATIYEVPQPVGEPIDVEALRTWAAKFGVTGDVYFDWYAGIPVDGSTQDGAGPSAYRIFAGDKRVTAYNGGEFIFEDVRYSMGFDRAPLPFAENQAIAERLVGDLNLLDVPYVVHQGWGYEVQFLLLVDGHPISMPVLTVSINPNGNVASVMYRPNLVGAVVGETALRPAADAWDYILRHQADGQIFFNLYATNPDYYMPSGTAGQKTHWQREFVSGEEIAMFAWVQTYRLADGSGTPLLITDRGIRLNAERGVLEQMADTAANGNNLSLRGTISGEPGTLTLEVASFAPVTGPSDIYLGGTSRQEGGATYLEVPGGYRFALANAPADLPVDTNMTVYSWGIRPDDRGLPILDWTAIDLWNVPYVQEVDYAAIDPYTGVTDVTIDAVQLGYQIVYPGEMVTGSTTVYNPEGAQPHLIPVWIFSGTTNKGDAIEFFFPAAAEIELR